MLKLEAVLAAKVELPPRGVEVVQYRVANFARPARRAEPPTPPPLAA